MTKKPKIHHPRKMGNGSLQYMNGLCGAGSVASTADTDKITCEACLKILSDAATKKRGNY